MDKDINRHRPDSPGGAGGGQQVQSSRQSARTASTAEQPQDGSPNLRRPQNQSGIGSSQGQDRGGRDRAESSDADGDIERPSPGSRESLVNDSTGAFKERP